MYLLFFADLKIVLSFLAIFLSIWELHFYLQMCMLLLVLIIVHVIFSLRNPAQGLVLKVDFHL